MISNRSNPKGIVQASNRNTLERETEMSRSSSTTIVNTVNNVTIYVDQVNKAGKSIGMTPVKPGSSISDAAQQFEKALQAKLVSDFKAIYNVDLTQNIDNGYAGPVSAIKPGNAPQCIVDQIQQDLTNWNLPITANLPTQMAQTITQHIVNQGGVANHAAGTLQVNSNEKLLWMAWFGTFDIENDQQGVVYAFGASVSF
jgi:hypothetical protein